MPKVQVKKQSVSLDMTAMCDVAFLLLTFFMLTAKAKPQEIEVTTPTSIAQAKIKAEDLCTIIVDKAGRVYWGTDKQAVRTGAMDAMATKYGMSFTAEEKNTFRLMESFGAPMSSLKDVLKAEPADRNRMGFQPGMPCDSAKNELFQWVFEARKLNPNIKIVVKGDGVSDYKVMKNIIGSLQEQNINQFSLLTGLEGKPGGGSAEGNGEAKKEE
jgi:biopolymer transport protein ExbD